MAQHHPLPDRTLRFNHSSEVSCFPTIVTELEYGRLLVYSCPCAAVSFRPCPRFGPCPAESCSLHRQYRHVTSTFIKVKHETEAMSELRTNVSWLPHFISMSAHQHPSDMLGLNLPLSDSENLGNKNRQTTLPVTRVVIYTVQSMECDFT